MNRQAILLTVLFASLPIVAAEPLPPGAIAQFGDTKYRASGAAFALSPDGMLVAVVEGETSVRIRDVEKWEVRVKLEPPAPPKEPAKRPDGEPLSVRVHHLQFSRDGKRIGAVNGSSANAYIAIWDVATGKVLRTASGPWPGMSRSFTMSGDLRYSASSGDVRTLGERTTTSAIHLRDNDANTLTTIPIGAFNANLMALSEDGSRIVAWSTRERAKGVAPKGSLKEPGEPNETADRYEFKIWNISTGKEVAQVRISKRPQEIAWSPDGESLAIRTGVSVNDMGVLSNEERGIWDMKTGKFRSRFVCPEATGSTFFVSNDIVGAVGLGGRFERREAATGRVLDLVECPGNEFQSVTIATATRADGSVRICGRAGQAFAIWDVVPGEKKPARVFGGFDGPCELSASLAFTPDGKTLRSLDQNGTLHSWDLESRRLSRTMHLLDAPWKSYEARRLHLTADARYGIVSREQTRVWDCERGIMTATYARNIPESAMAFDGALVPGVDEAIQKVSALQPKSGTGRDQYIALHDARYVVALVERPAKQFGQYEAELSVYDTSSMKAVSRTLLPRDPPRLFTFSPDGRHIVLLGSQNLFVWDWRASRMVCSAANAPESVPGFSPDGRLVARGLAKKGSQDSGIEVREVASGNVRFVLPGSARGAVAFSPDGKVLAAGAPDATILLWDLSPSKGAMWAAAESDAIWAGLANVDAVRGYEQMIRLLAHPHAAVELLRNRIKVSDSKLDISQLVRLLDNDQLAVREKASRELGQLGEPAIEPMRKVLESSPSPEARRRIEFLLDDLASQLHLAAIRPIRVVEVLERLSTPAARELLESFAKSPEETVLTREAKAALERGRPAKK